MPNEPFTQYTSTQSKTEKQECFSQSQMGHVCLHKPTYYFQPFNQKYPTRVQFRDPILPFISHFKAPCKHSVLLSSDNASPPRWNNYPLFSTTCFNASTFNYAIPCQVCYLLSIRCHEEWEIILEAGQRSRSCPVKISVAQPKLK